MTVHYGQISTAMQKAIDALEAGKKYGDEDWPKKVTRRTMQALVERGLAVWDEELQTWVR